MDFNWILQSAISSRRRYLSWDILLVDMAWSATRWRLRTSSLGRCQIALRVFASFLGFVGYYRRFIPNFADIETPMVASQRRYSTTKREMLASMAMCIQFRSYLRGVKFTLRTDHKSLVWLHRFKGTEGMMARWLHVLQQFQFSFVHRPGRDHGNADGLSRVPSSPCRQCMRPDCPPAAKVTECAALIHIHSGEDWVVLLDDDLSQPTAIASDSFRISALQKEDPVCITLSSWISSGLFPTWTEVRGLCPELRLLWHHRNNLTVDDNRIIWVKEEHTECCSY